MKETIIKLFLRIEPRRTRRVILLSSMQLLGFEAARIALISSSISLYF